MIEGHLHPDFWPVARLLERQLQWARPGGAAVCVYHRGEKVVDIWGGSRDHNGNPWQEDTMGLSFSTTKGVTATALHILIDCGLLDYEDPVQKYWPEFGQNGKERITVRHLLCHEAGLYGLRHRIDNARRILDWPYMVDLLEHSTPAHEPGAANGYHALTFGWLIGELIQRVTKERFSSFIKSEIVAPLRLDGLFIGTPPEKHHRAAEVIRSKRGMHAPHSLKRFAKPLQSVFSTLRVPIDLARMADALVPRGIEDIDWSSPEVRSVPIPAANGLFTARSLARMYAALAAGGELDGVRLLSEAGLKRATEVQNRRVDLVIPIRMCWRLGYHRVFTLGSGPPRAFGHFGFGGSGAWADPDRNLAVALVVNSGMGTPFGDLRIVRISGTAIRCADRRGASSGSDSRKKSGFQVNHSRPGGDGVTKIGEDQARSSTSDKQSSPRSRGPLA